MSARAHPRAVGAFVLGAVALLLVVVLALDARLPVKAGAHPILHAARGALCCIDDFAPVDQYLLGFYYFYALQRYDLAAENLFCPCHVADVEPGAPRG